MGMRADQLPGVAPDSAPAPLTAPTQISTADAQNMGPSAPIYYTEPKPAPNLLQRGAEDIEKPFIQMQHTLGAGLSMLGDNLKSATPFGELGASIAKAGIVMQERSIASMQKKFSNFTPNMLDNIIGTAPTLAGYFGLAAASTVGIATGALAVGVGTGMAAEEFEKLRAKGHGTAWSDFVGGLEGTIGGGVMALGFNKVGEFVEPWFTKTIGATIAKMVGARTAALVGKGVEGAAAGTVGMAAQGATASGGEALTGVMTDDQGKPMTSGSEESLKVLTDTVHSGIMGFVLGGGLGTTFALHQMNTFEKNLTQLGFTPKEAHQNAVMVFGQGGHMLMDAVNQNLKFTQDENARVTSPAATGTVQPNILEKSGIPQDLNYPSVAQLPKENADVQLESSENKYVKLEPLNFFSFHLTFSCFSEYSHEL